MPIAQRTAREAVDQIQSRTDLAAFIRDLRENLRRNPDEWENPTLDRYLEAMAAWVEDMHGYYLNRGDAAPQEPTWKVIGDILIAAKMYE